MIKIPLPALVVLVMNIYIDISEFDTLDAEWTTDLIFDYEEFPDEEFECRKLEIFHS